MMCFFVCEENNRFESLLLTVKIINKLVKSDPEAEHQVALDNTCSPINQATQESSHQANKPAAIQGHGESKENEVTKESNESQTKSESRYNGARMYTSYYSQ